MSTAGALRRLLAVPHVRGGALVMEHALGGATFLHSLRPLTSVATNTIGHQHGSNPHPLPEPLSAHPCRSLSEAGHSRGNATEAASVSGRRELRRPRIITNFRRCHITSTADSVSVATGTSFAKTTARRQFHRGFSASCTSYSQHAGQEEEVAAVVPAVHASSNGVGGGAQFGGESEAQKSPHGPDELHYFNRPDDPGSVTLKTAESTQVLMKEYLMPVTAYHIGTRLNFYSLAQSPEFARCPRALNRDSIILSLEPRKKGQVAQSASDKYMAVFKYGSVVFFNVKVEQRLKLLQVCEQFTDSPVAKPQIEDFAVLVRPDLKSWSELQPDSVVLKRMDTNSIRVISSVLGQSVALDMYASKVESSLEVFSNLNREMERTGTFTIKKGHLFRLVAQNNILITEIITKLGLLERSDTAWKYAQYGPIWEGLRNEFELEARFQTLDLKINLIQNNVKYFLEILQNRKSDTLEWIIIILIAGEIMLGLYEIFSKV